MSLRIEALLRLSQALSLLVFGYEFADYGVSWMWDMENYVVLWRIHARSYQSFRAAKLPEEYTESAEPGCDAR